MCSSQDWSLIQTIYAWMLHAADFCIAVMYCANVGAARMTKQKKNPTQVFKVVAQGDTLYIEALTRVEAQLILRQHMGDIPESLLTWSGPMPLPQDEEALS